MKNCPCNSTIKRVNCQADTDVAGSMEKIDIWIFSENNYKRALKDIISRYTGLSADEINITEEPFEKPVLKNPEVREKLHFNLSHSAGEAVLAVSDLPVGVDIEEIRDLHSFKDVINYVCTPEEKRIIERMDENTSKKLFFDIWVRKEACVKAFGLDILSSAGHFPCVAEDSSVPEGWVFLEMFWYNREAWYLYNPVTIRDYAGACCTPKSGAIFQIIPYSG